MSRFITNQNTKDLAQRLRELIGFARELKFLTGYFYFSAWPHLYEALKEAFARRPELRMKILVGLEADTRTGELLELARGRGERTRNEHREAFLASLAGALAHPSLDLPDFPEQARFFLDLLEGGRLELRKTRDPNHAKLYLFAAADEHRGLLRERGVFLTGSSNLTHAGLAYQHEFNVEVGDHGFDEAEGYFDELWQAATPLSPEDLTRVRWMVERASLAAQPTPFEIYALLVKRFLEATSLPHREGPGAFLERLGYKPYLYQLDAVEAVLKTLETYRGAILADVVGLGKTVVASLVGREMGERGIVIAPPALIGDGHYGWTKYLGEFGLHDWRVFSIGNLQEAIRFLQTHGQDVGLVVVDEAHRFRNPETQSYALLRAITAGRKVLLLTATPYNNQPADIYALLSLFDTPGHSRLAPRQNLAGYFKELDDRFQDLSYILRYHNHPDPKKRRRALELYGRLIDKEAQKVSEGRVKAELERLGKQVRAAMAPVTVRRNRLDLKKNPRYRDQIPDFPEVKDPEPLLYELTLEQGKFYDRVVGEWFGEEGRFKGAIYRPEEFLKGEREEEEGSEAAFRLESQRNLAEFMRRLLVRRFESSFGAFGKTLERIGKRYAQAVQQAQKGVFYLDWKLMEELGEEGELDLDYEKPAAYRQEDYPDRWEAFLKALQEDLALLTKVMTSAAKLRLSAPEVDPKARRLVEFLKETLKREPGRKVLVFSEYTDTVEHLGEALKAMGMDRVLVVGKDPPSRFWEAVSLNFDASLKEEVQRNDYDVLIASDRLSEGFNLHRAGVLINYDIPWNPVRLVQRIGRVNRIGKKVFSVFASRNSDEIRVYHFFPTERGKEVANPIEVAKQKLFLIHKALGEDSKILSPEEEPSPAGLYQRLVGLPEEELSFDAWLRGEWERLRALDPDLEGRIRDLPARVKTARPAEEPFLLLVAQKGLGYFGLLQGSGKAPLPLAAEEVLEWARAEPETPRLAFTRFGEYRALEAWLLREKPASWAYNSLERRALNLVGSLLSKKDALGLEEAAVRRLEAVRSDLQLSKRLPRYVLRRLVELLPDEPDPAAVRKALEYLEPFASLLGPPPAETGLELLVAVEGQSCPRSEG